MYKSYLQKCKAVKFAVILSSALSWNPYLCEVLELILFLTLQHSWLIISVLELILFLTLQHSRLIISVPFLKSLWSNSGLVSQSVPDHFLSYPFHFIIYHLYRWCYTGRFIMYSGNTKIYYRKTVEHVFTKPVQIEGITQFFSSSKLFFIVVHISAARRCECM